MAWIDPLIVQTCGFEVFLVPIDNNSYFVPFAVDGNNPFLKTAFPQRRASRDYLKENGINNGYGRKRTIGNLRCRGDET